MEHNCGHNPNLEDNSLELLNIRKMTYPQKYYFVCDKCHEIFCFIKCKGDFEMM